VRRRHKTPHLPRSVELGPVFSPHPTELSSSPRPSRASPNRSRRAPQSARLRLATAVPEDSGLHPLLKPIMCRRMCTQLCLIEGLPTSIPSERHVEDRVAQARSGTRGRPPPKRCVLSCTESLVGGRPTAHRKCAHPVVVRLFGFRCRFGVLVSCSLMPLLYQVIRIGFKTPYCADDARPVPLHQRFHLPAQRSARLFAGSYAPTACEWSAN
jgi:hypothetical protein